jgi:IS4 transposase
VLVLTTLSPAVLSAQTIMGLYRCRWQVEIAIKRLTGCEFCKCF